MQDFWNWNSETGRTIECKSTQCFNWIVKVIIAFRYRLLAIDHGMFSFIDVQHGDWPVVLVTNPKNSLFLIPHKEDLNVIKNSTHIRILAFSLSDIAVVELKINNEDWNMCQHRGGPLFVREWNPNDYSEGLHKILVI